MEDLEKKINEDGLILLSGILSDKLLDDLFKTIFNLFNKAFPELFSWKLDEVNKSIWENQKFHNSIIDSRKANPKKFGAIYDALQLTAISKKILTSKKILKIISSIYDKDISNISCRNSIIRMDCPSDDRNSVDWHSDIISTKNKNHHPRDGITVNVAFHDTLPEHGSVFFLIGSHIEKNVQLISENKKNNTSDYYQIPESIIKKYKSFQPKKFNSGDVAIFPMTLIHKSGNNESNKVRISGVFRFYPISSNNFLFQKEEIVDNNV